MKFKRSPIFNKMLHQLAERRGTTAEEVLAAEEARVIEGAQRANKLGEAAQETLEEDLKRMREASYPGPECLMPDELEEIAAAEELPEGAAAHLAACKDCSALLAAIQPDPDKVEQILQAVRQADLKIEIRTEKEDVKQRGAGASAGAYFVERE